MFTEIYWLIEALRKELSLLILARWAYLAESYHSPYNGIRLSLYIMENLHII